MPTLPSLLKQLENLHRLYIQTEQQIAEVKRAIVAASKPEPKKRRTRSTHTESSTQQIKDVIKVLQGTDEPLPRREIAQRLGLSSAALTYRLQRAIDAKFVEKTGHGRYRVSADVPAL